jgi:hypothetical protein
VILGQTRAECEYFVRFVACVSGCVLSACTSLPAPDITVTALQSGVVTVDSTDMVFTLPSAVTGAQRPALCMILDTLQYVFRPAAEHFHPLPLTDTTLYSRVDGIRDSTPIVLIAVLEGSTGERVGYTSGAYSPGTGMDTPYNHSHLLGAEGESVCLSWELHSRGAYTKLRLRSNRLVVLHDLTWHYFTNRT